MSWRKISMKFPGTCIENKKKIEANEMGLWAKGLGVKHEKCAEVNELTCIVCGGPAGCSKCEYADDCDLTTVSQLCICRKCNETDNPFDAYQKSVKKKFSILNLN